MKLCLITATFVQQPNGSYTYSSNREVFEAKEAAKSYVTQGERPRRIKYGQLEEIDGAAYPTPVMSFWVWCLQEREHLVVQALREHIEERTSKWLETAVAARKIWLTRSSTKA